MKDVAIIDSGGANLASLQFALERLGAHAIVTSEAARINNAERIILPGVGAARDAMLRLETSGLDEVLRGLEQPVLGICLGMQLLFEKSAEGETNCLGIVPGRAARLTAAPGRPVPHMGWNQLASLREDALLEDIEENSYVYFVHSYALPVSDLTLAAAQYGGVFSAVVRHENFWGTQFHPERSSAVGARILANFLKVH